MGDMLKHALEAWGPRARVCYVRWAPSAANPQAVPSTQMQGIQRITRSGAGAYQIVLLDKCKDMVVIVGVVEDNTTHYHFARVESKSPTAGTVNISHKSVAFASVASGPAGSDTVDGLEVFIIQRMYD